MLRLLKEEEYWQFVRRGSEANLTTVAELTEEEAVWAGYFWAP